MAWDCESGSALRKTWTVSGLTGDRCGSGERRLKARAVWEGIKEEELARYMKDSQEPHLLG